ncbi:Fis family transcriptional regulator [Marinomonas ushuaiensis DSM 15871]|uniref:Fis family transcriptional regulator n=1 Tax=Marinomonas ushuaiensis DSM 15871 TaxID=1122207 RepID=X7E0Z9_9GAMM|nr:MATE family efflux transporter [Marinomonas ushuaiensis]ETX09642.1 Fis family transcriptional regulator [Marinomonas ushuaiensis DSM 15871]
MSSQSESTTSLAKQLFSMTWPMLFGVLSMMSFQLVDSAFIGQLGILPLAAQGFTLPIQMIVIGLQVGLGIATTAIIARALGAGNENYAKQLGGLVLMIGSVGMVCFCLLIWWLRHPILTLLSAPESVFPVIDAYWPYWLFSVFVGALTYFYYSICRSNGNTFLPGIMMVVTSVLNLILDPIFIFTLDLGLNGAAIATILSFIIGLLIVASQVTRKHWVSFDWKDLNVGKSLASIGHIMGPAMVSQLLPSASSILATKLIAGFGTAAVASWALGSRFEFFIIVSVLALTMSMPPMVGRLLGANKIAEIREVVSIACRFVLGFQLLVAIVTFLASDFLANLMTSEKAVSEILNWHLVLVPISLGSLGICMLMVSVANALGKSYTALSISALRLFVFFLPCLWIGSELAGLKGLFVGVLIGNLLAGLCAWNMYQRLLRKIELGS